MAIGAERTKHSMELSSTNDSFKSKFNQKKHKNSICISPGLTLLWGYLGA